MAEKSEGPLQSIIVGVAVAVISAVILYMLDINSKSERRNTREPSPGASSPDPRLVSPVIEQPTNPKGSNDKQAVACKEAMEQYNDCIDRAHQYGAAGRLKEQRGEINTRTGMESKLKSKCYELIAHCNQRIIGELCVSCDQKYNEQEAYCRSMSGFVGCSITGDTNSGSASATDWPRTIHC